MPKHNDAPDLQVELERVNAMIEKHTIQLETVNGALQEIESEMQRDDPTRQLLDSHATSARAPLNLPAEEALDTITSLKNRLKVVRRRNQLLARENAAQQRDLNERSKLLLRDTREYDELLFRTGWDGQSAADPDDLKQKAADVQEMARLERMVQKELQGAQSIIRKKEAAIRDLEARLEMSGETYALLNNVYNDIRVKERDCHELEARLQQMRKQDAKNEEALTVFRADGKNASLVYMETDINYIKEAVTEMKNVCRRQDTVLKAQIARQQQLQDRLDSILKSLREVKLEKEYKRNPLKADIVPSASREEPDDVSQILPEDEQIPVHTYRLIYRNNELMRSRVARKNMLVLEKEGVIQSLEENLMRHGSALAMTTKQRDELKLSKDLEMGELIDELRQQHQNFLQQLEQLSLENNQLKRKLCLSSGRHDGIKRQHVV